MDFKDKLQKHIQEELDRMVDQGGEPALQFAAYYKGELVCNAYASADNVDVNADTLFPVFSTSKGIASTPIHMLIEQGELSLEERVCAYWPEFAQNGKANITVEMLMNHRAGLSPLPLDGTVEMLCDWEAMIHYYERAAPCHEPGKEKFYHGVSFGWLVGELVRRITQVDFQQWVDTHIAQPLGLRGLNFGLPSGTEQRHVDAIPLASEANAGMSTVPISNVEEQRIQDINDQAIPHYIQPLEDYINNPLIRKACMPATNGFMDAHSIAQHYAALVGDGVDGVKLLSDETVERAITPTEPRLAGCDHAMGYLVFPYREQWTRFGHGGYGGSDGYAIHGLNLAYGFTTMRMGSCTAEQLLDLVVDAIQAV